VLIVLELMRASWAGLGCMFISRSAEPDLDVDARLPCLARRSRDEARIEDVVEMLKVWWESPPVPTMSHYMENERYYYFNCIYFIAIFDPQSFLDPASGNRLDNRRRFTLSTSGKKTHQASVIFPLRPSSF